VSGSQGLLDRVVGGLTRAAETAVEQGEEQLDQAIRPDRAQRRLDSLENLPETGEALGAAFEDAVDQAFGGAFDTLEDDVVEALLRESTVDEANVEERVNQAEGAAVEDAVGVISGLLGIEALGKFELETHEELVTQVFTGLALQDVLGLRSALAVEDGVQPALRRRINRQAQSKIVDLQDAVEEELRAKSSDSGFLSGKEEYGLPQEEVRRLERAALNSVEPEELLETPVQYGIVPDTDTVAGELDRAGISEPLKALFQEVAEAAPRTTQFYEERTVAEQLVPQLDQQVESGERTPQEAAEALPDELDEVRAALRDRWDLLQTEVRDEPSDSDVLDSLSKGLINLDTAIEELNEPGREPSEVARRVAGEAFDQLDGDLRTAVGLGLLDEARFSETAAVLGLDQQAIDSLLEGEDLDEIALRRLQASDQQAGRSVTALIGIGDARGSALTAADLGTVDQLAQADPERVAEIAQVSQSTAEDFVAAARRRTQQAS